VRHVYTLSLTCERAYKNRHPSHFVGGAFFFKFPHRLGKAISFALESMQCVQHTSEIVVEICFVYSVHFALTLAVDLRVLHLKVFVEVIPPYFFRFE